MRRVIALAALILACVYASPALAEYESPKLAAVASVFAMQPVTVTCSTPAEDWLLEGAWGYVFLFDPVVHTSPYLCEAAEHVTDPVYGLSVRALAVMVVTHEAYHLRKQWSDRGDEGKVQCRAIRHFRYAAQMLGASPELATELRAYALYHHWKLAARFPEYHFADCVVPKA